MNWRKQVEDFKTELRVEPSRISVQSVKIGFFGPVGSGKSVTAGICAVGISPPDSKIAWIDGEGERSGLAIDQVAEMAAQRYGGTKEKHMARFQVIHIAPPFNPLRVVSAIEIAEANGCRTAILDILTQCWDSEGGYLDMKETALDAATGGDDRQRDKKAQSVGAKLKPWTHQQLVHKIDSSRINLVLVFQAKNKWNAKKSGMDELSSPIQENGMTRLAVAVGRVECRMNNGTPQGGYCQFAGELNDGTKSTHPQILKRLPANGEQFRFDHAEAIAAWCAQGGSGATASAPTAQTSGDELGALKKRLGKLLRGIVEPLDKEHMTAWLVENLCMDPAADLSELTTKELSSVITLVEERIKQ